MAGSANRRRRQSDGAHQAAESRSASKQQTNPARPTRIRFRKVSAFPGSFLTPRRSQRNEGRTEPRPKTPKSRPASDNSEQSTTYLLWIWYDAREFLDCFSSHISSHSSSEAKESR